MAPNGAWQWGQEAEKACLQTQTQSRERTGKGQGYRLSKLRPQ